ncbi:complement C1q subcomponent subunit B precursor [Callorhinchus milii]|uniref:Complement C1q subcomponent subunit C-like protein n=1 Tax=Callorhinchus milii TaxID=7868 RepID=K4FSX4_CALMI|nr:complement C1q subcomponent subunit B precursor [Callorhinchus milii]AFK11213.1 complement C1q subcomponent subunit C-like protein [Callorhinchus milii]
MHPVSVCLALLCVVMFPVAEESGVPGIPGMPGIPGNPGRDGRDSVKGPRGKPGSLGAGPGESERGEKGDAGTVGQPGKRGHSGKQGAKGEPGIPGERGDVGKSGHHKSSLKSAFSARRAGNESPPRDTPIVFSRDISNDQQHYDNTTGKFTCYINGYYYFVYHATSNSNLCLGLIKNGEKKVGFCNRGGAQQVTSGGSVLHLNINDTVWLEPTDYNAMLGSEDTNSFFSGFLIFPD